MTQQYFDYFTATIYLSLFIGGLVIAIKAHGRSIPERDKYGNYYQKRSNNSK